MKKSPEKWQELCEVNLQETDLSSDAKSNSLLVENDNFLADQRQNKYVFFIFSNPISGGNKANAFLNLEVEKMVFPSFRPTGDQVEIYFYSLVDATNRNTGLELLKKTQKDKTAEIRVIVGGGDGSIMWLIEEMIRVGISFKRCPIGCIPFGTGNDLSRVLGWGGEEPSELVGTHLKSLKGLVRQWMEATPQDLDVWEITIEVYEEGGLRRVHKEKGKSYEERYLTEKDPFTGEEKKRLQFTRKMCNYFSFGIDAMTGYGFDKQRTASRIINKTIYCWEGFKRMFTNNNTVNRLLHKVEEYKELHRSTHQTEASSPQDEHDHSIEKIEYSGKKFLLYPSTFEDERQSHASIIKGDPSIFLCLNIPSYMGGAVNPWGAAKGNIGVTDHLNRTLSDFPDQKFGDGKLEILSFDGPLSLGMERILPGRGKRIGQTEGPFLLNFKRSEVLGQPLKTYMNIDGEYFKVLAPKSVKLSLSKDIPRGKVEMLVKKGFKIA